MTLAELQTLRDTLVDELSTSGGVTSVSSDGMSVSVDRKAQLDAIDAEIRRVGRTNPFACMAKRQIVPPGGGG